MIQDEQMFLNGAGDMVQSVWDDIPLNYPGIGTDQFVIMPNHVHGIILILGDPHHKNPLSRSPQQNGQTKLSLPDMVHRIKTMTTKRYADGVKQSGWTPFPRRLWQRNYWEHIARNESELRLIREYIQNNPVKWESDTLSVEPAPSVHPFPLVP
jgi:REP element-mobilizing transposase RayT